MADWMQLDLFLEYQYQYFSIDLSLKENLS